MPFVHAAFVDRVRSVVEECVGRGGGMNGGGGLGACSLVGPTAHHCSCLPPWCPLCWQHSRGFRLRGIRGRVGYPVRTYSATHSVICCGGCGCVAGGGGGCSAVLWGRVECPPHCSQLPLVSFRPWGGGVGTRPWWLALLACGAAYWPFSLEPSALGGGGCQKGCHKGLRGARSFAMGVFSGLL